MSRKDLRGDEANGHSDGPLDELISALNKRIRKFNQKILNVNSELQPNGTRGLLQQTEELTESKPKSINIASPSRSVDSLSDEDVSSCLQTLLPLKSGGLIEQMCKKYKINYGPFAYGSQRDYHSYLSCTGQDIAGKRKKDSRKGKELTEVETRKILREIESIQSRIEKENIVLTSQVVAIESIRDEFRKEHLSQGSLTPESTVVPQTVERNNRSSDKNDSPLKSNNIAHALQAVKDFNTLELLFDAYGITDLVEGVPSQLRTKKAKQGASPIENSNAAASRKRTQETPPSLILKGSNGVSAYKPGPKMFKNEGTQTLPEFLLPLDVHSPPSDGLFDKVLWVRCKKQPQAASDGGSKMVKGRDDKNSHDSHIDQYDITIIDPATSREFIKKPYTPIDWDHVYDEGATNSYLFCGEAISSYPSHLASSRTLAYGGASSESGSLRAACDGSFLCQSLTQSVYSQPLAGSSLHVSEPATLRTSILTEVDPLSPNKVRLALPMTHISGNSYAMGTIIVRDRDLLLFKEGAEDKKMTPLPYRAIASIRLGSTPAAADRTVIPSLNMNIPPAATQFFLMNKIQFSDTYRQFYRTVVIQPLSVGDDNQNTTATNANSNNSVPPPSSIIFDTESDCIEFLNTLDLILNPSLRGRPFSPFSKSGIPPPAKSHVGLDYLTIAGGAGTGRRPAPCLYSPTEKRQLGFAKSAAITPLDVFPTHDPLTPAEMDICSNLHIPPRLLSEIKSRLLSDPTRTWISALDVAVLCTPANSKVLDMRVARQVLDFFVSQNKLKVVEIVETLPAGEQVPQRKKGGDDVSQRC